MDKTKKKKSSAWSTVLLFAILLLGVAIIAYPTVSDWWNSFHQTRAIASYEVMVEQTNTEELDAMVESARRYNKALLTKDFRFELSEEELAEYNALLDLGGDGAMGYISIPRIGVNLPVYHGTSEAVLQIAVGHIEGTSLPVGGESTHCALSGHRGLPSARLFTDLDQLQAGDQFVLTVLNQVLTYEVDQIRIVLPYEMDDLAIVSGADYCTLITCTPYGVNTHRMLVRGHRIEVAPEEAPVVVTAGAIRIPTYIVIPAVAIPLLFLFLLGMLVYYRQRRPQLTEAELSEQFRRNFMQKPEDEEGPEPPAEERTPDEKA